MSAAALFSTKEELSILIERPDYTDLTLVAVTPEGDYELKKRNLPPLSIEDYINFEEVSVLAQDNFQKVEFLMKAISHLHSKDPLLSEIILVATHFHCLKIFYDRYWLYSLVAKKLLLKFDKIIFFKENESDSIFDPKNLNLLAHILFYLSQKDPIKYDVYDPKETTEINVKNISKFSIMKILKKLKHYGENKIRLILPLKSKVVIKKRIDWNLYQTMINKGVQTIPISSSKQIKSFPKINKYLADINYETLKSAFLLHGIDLFDLMIPQIREFIELCKNHHKRHCLFWLKKLKGSLVKAAITLIPGNAEEIGFWVAANRFNIKQIIPQHGGFHGYVDYPMNQYLERKLASVIPVYGDGCQQTFTPVETVTVGSPICYKLYHNRNNNKILNPKKKILIISDALQRSDSYFSWHIKPAIETSRMQQRMIELIGENADIYLKFYPHEQHRNPVYSWIRDQNIQLNDFTDIPLEMVLLNHEFDLIISDAPATTLLQAVSTNVPIIAYFDKRYYRFREEGIKLLKKRVTLFDNYDSFFDNLSTMSHYKFTQSPSSDLIDDSFLFTYGLKDANTNPLDEWCKIVEPYGIK